VGECLPNPGGNLNNGKGGLMTLKFCMHNEFPLRVVAGEARLMHLPCFHSVKDCYVRPDSLLGGERRDFTGSSLLPLLRTTKLPNLEV